MAEGGSASGPTDRLCQLLTLARKSITRYLDQGWHVSLHLVSIFLKAEGSLGPSVPAGEGPEKERMKETSTSALSQGDPEDKEEEPMAL